MALQVVSGDNVVCVVLSSDVVFSCTGSVVVDGCPGSTVEEWMHHCKFPSLLNNI